MSTLVFKMRYVPEDEANAVRDTLEKNNIDFFETTAGNWGIGSPGLWVEDEDVVRARELIDAYQVTRKEAFDANDDKPAWYAQFVKHPFAALGIVLFCAFIVYALVSPFIRLALESKGP